MFAAGSLKSKIYNLRLQSETESSIFEQIIKGLARVIGLGRQPCGGLLLHAHADGIESTVIARIFFCNPLWDRLHAFEAARRVKVAARLARVQLKAAFRALAT